MICLNPYITCESNQIFATNSYESATNLLRICHNLPRIATHLPRIQNPRIATKSYAL
ncbi:hypothetical protein [Helicobacter sp. 23-1045]